MKKQKPKKNKAKKDGIYLDYASATPISKNVLAVMSEFSGVFANPGGIHAKSVEAKKLIAEARKRIAKAIDARPEEIVFTASATESNMLALQGSVNAWKKMFPSEVPHAIISAIEHPSVMETAKMLEDNGVLVSRISVDEHGVINLPELKNAIQQNTVIVSVMQANNEIGTIEPIDAITKTLRHYKKEISKNERAPEYPLFHVDATQAFQYMPIRVIKPEVDFMTISSGKIYGPRGIALLFARNNSPLDSVMHGGGQEDGRRGGTEATMLIAGFAQAIEEAVAMRAKETLRLEKILDAGKKELAKRIPDAKLLGHPTKRLPNNLCFSISGIESDYLVLALSAKKIYASSRSACSADKVSGNELDSHVILSIGGNPTDGTVRLSFGRDTKTTDILQAIKVTAEAVSQWRMWSHAHKK